MLLKIFIRNFILIDELELQFTPNLNIITGETGAGKSILMGALGLILGQRVQGAIVPTGGEKCIVEAVFIHPEDERGQHFFKENDLDVANELTLRREISATGKSRCFINDTPVNLTQMRQLGELLVDLHQQFDTNELENEHFQRSVIDALAGSEQLANTVKSAFGKWQQLVHSLETVKAAYNKSLEALDYHRFLFEELEALKLKEGELELLDEELQLLNNVEQVKRELAELSFMFKEGEAPVLHQLKYVQHKLQTIGGYHPGLSVLGDRLFSTVIEINDIINELEQISDNVEYNADRIQWINDRLNEGYRLQKKHGVNNTAELLGKQVELKSLLQGVNDNNAQLDQLEYKTNEAYKYVAMLAKELSGLRFKQISPFEKNVNKLLKQIGMPNARIKVELIEDELTLNGAEKVLFLFNGNVTDNDSEQVRYESLSKVASGGERSRLMMSIKSLVAKKLQMPTLIFDEIDSGISGEAAKQVGRIMKDLSASHQIISITHQPQVAARADTHYFVYKLVEGAKVRTLVKQLSYSERVAAIAQMLSGEKPTSAALENAREMVDAR